MPFGLKNVPPTYQQVVSIAFKDYFGVFMKLFLDGFNVFNDLSYDHVFDECKIFGISLNPQKCMFLMHLGVILG
jgi:hypothetical protein